MKNQIQLELPLGIGTYGGNMASQKLSTSRYFKSNKELAAYVKSQLPSSPDDLPWTITIEAGKFEGFYVRIVTTE
jgi:hypothetical protein